MTDVKLLTEAEAKGAWSATYSTHAKSFAEYTADLRERGLIAPEPVDALLIEARQVVVRNTSWRSYEREREFCLKGEYDGGDYVNLALAALRRGMELAPASPLTRKMVREAVIKAAPEDIETCDFLEDAGSVCRDDAEAFVTRLHAALSERQA